LKETQNLSSVAKDPLYGVLQKMVALNKDCNLSPHTVSTKSISYHYLRRTWSLRW